MKSIFKIIVILSPFLLHSQSPSDSLKIVDYWNKTSLVPLFSAKRQLYLDSILAIKPNYAYAWQQKAMPLFKQMKYELGMKYLDSAVKYDKTFHWHEYRAFIKCIFQKNYSEAIRDFKSVKLRNNEGYVMDHSYEFYIGLSFLQLNQFDSAYSYIKSSIDMGEKKWKTGHYLEYMYLGIVSMERQDSLQANKYLDKAIALYSNFSDAKYYKAMLWFTSGNINNALVLFKDALKDLSNGYTINEDNAIYESYPYQINKKGLEQFIEYLQSPKE